MLAVDTNVLVRILIDDPGAARQCAAARKLAESAGSLHVSQVVQIETVWVLESVYGFARTELVEALATLLHNQSFDLQEAVIFRAALESFRAGPADFADCVILVHARTRNAELATFDRKLGKLSGARLVAA